MIFLRTSLVKSLLRVMSHSSSPVIKEENGKKRDLKETLLRTGLAASAQQQWREPWGCSQAVLVNVQSELKLELLGVECYLCGCLLCAGSEKKSHSLHIRQEKTWKQRTSASSALACRGIATKRRAIVKANLITRCVFPKDSPSPSLSAKQKHLTCLGQV